MTKRLEVVNEQLSKNHINDDDEPIPVSDIPSVDEHIKKEPVNSASVVVSMISAEKVDAISYMEKPISNQLDKVKTFINKNRR
jgi:hypothetical protein